MRLWFKLLWFRIFGSKPEHGRTYWAGKKEE